MAVPITFSGKMDACLLPMVSAQRAAVKTAFTDLQTALAGELTTFYGPTGPPIGRALSRLEGDLIDLANSLSSNLT